MYGQKQASRSAEEPILFAKRANFRRRFHKCDGPQDCGCDSQSPRCDGDGRHAFSLRDANQYGRTGNDEEGGTEHGIWQPSFSVEVGNSAYGQNRVSLDKWKRTKRDYRQLRQPNEKGLEEIIL